MQKPASRTSGIRLAELVGALTIATDLGMGQPMEYVLRSCVLSVRLGEAIGLSESELREVYYLALLRSLGCNAGTHEQAALVGDEVAMRTAMVPVYGGDPPQIMDALVSHLRTMYIGLSAPELDRVIPQLLLSFQSTMQESAAGHCEVGQRLAARFGFGEPMQQALGQAYERWDGQGVPAGLKGEEIPLSVRIVSLAYDAVLPLTIRERPRLPQMLEETPVRPTSWSIPARQTATISSSGRRHWRAAARASSATPLEWPSR